MYISHFFDTLLMNWNAITSTNFSPCFIWFFIEYWLIACYDPIYFQSAGFTFANLPTIPPSAISQS